MPTFRIMQSFLCHNEIFYIFVQYTFSSVWENSAELKGENQYRWDNYETHSDSQKRYDNMTSIILTIISARVKFASSWHIQNSESKNSFDVSLKNWQLDKSSICFCNQKYKRLQNYIEPSHSRRIGRYIRFKTSSYHISLLMNILYFTRLARR